MSEYKIISSGSHGNAVLYYGNILVDIGVPFSKIQPYMYDLQLVLLTHEHQDHINYRTLEKLLFERPSLRLGVPAHMIYLILNKLSGVVRKLDPLVYGKWYDYGEFKISPIKLYHDVPNCGYRIFKEDHKIIHATDTCTLEGIEANNYDLFMIESNYNDEILMQRIKEKGNIGAYAYERGSPNTHLSSEQCNQFFFENKGEHSKLVRLHESKHNS